jgi:hypothetical protein
VIGAKVIEHGAELHAPRRCNLLRTPGTGHKTLLNFTTALEHIKEEKVFIRKRYFCDLNFSFVQWLAFV